MGVLVIPEGKTVLFRIAIFIGLGTVVTTIIYLTPIPDQYPQSCSRICHELDWPMICRVKLTLERYQTLGRACKNCHANKTDCYNENCITVDGHVGGILTANRQFPGPVLQVCQHDIVVVDVVNRVPGQSFGVHWRGQPQTETPYMDGVSMITQCPIPSLTTFQYKFRASESGTHVWQVNTGEEMHETLFGPFIVRRPHSKEVHRELYDVDDTDNVIVVHTWTPRKSSYLFHDNATPVKLLINGKTQENGFPPSVFHVTPGKRHRFRVVYAGSAKTCQIRLSIDGHKILVIALDGISIEPEMVASVSIFPGERLDFVLDADRPASSYLLRAAPVGSCPTVAPTSAIVKYLGTKDNSLADFRDKELSGAAPELETLLDETCTKNSVCLQDIHSVKPIPKELFYPDVKFYFFYTSAVVSHENILNTSFVALGDSMRVPQANNLTMMLPSSPLLSQDYQVPENHFCNGDFIPERCGTGNMVCECVHVVDVPVNAVVELVLVNQDKDDHVFHLHGYNFRVMGASKLPGNHMDPKEIKDLDEGGNLVKRSFGSPVVKDTVAVVNSSAVVIRFKADNPGYWLLDEERSSHWLRGMSLVLHVGAKSDLPPLPKNFPKCGDWIGPEFFLV